MSSTLIEIRNILDKNEICLQTEIIIVNQSKVYFITPERVLLSVDLLKEKWKVKLLNRFKNVEHNNKKLLSIIHDLAIPMTSIRV